MKVFMIAGKDAANQTLARIARAYVDRGHEVVIYATYYAENVLHWFDKTFIIHPFEELDEKVLDSCDIIFSEARSRWPNKKILFVDKPVFTYNYCIDRQIKWGGDFCFVAANATVASQYDEYLNYRRIEIGEPKYDSLEVSVEEQKMFLFIDSGYYPFGAVGKRELADALLEIAKAYPDYELWVKPRFLPDDTVISHKNTRHLYDIIREEAGDDLPDNLVMLTEHRDLKELIDLSHTVICMHTTAFVGAYAADKGLIVLDGLPSEDVYDIRWKSLNLIREQILPSGAVIPYQEAKNYLPDGVRCTKEYKRYLLAEWENTAAKICEVTEYFYEEFFSKGKFPKLEADTSYVNVRDDVFADAECNWSKVICRRCEDFLFAKMLFNIDSRVKAALDIQDLVREAKNLPSVLDESEMKKKSDMASFYQGQCIVDNYNLMLQDDIDAGILLNALYNIGEEHYEEIKTFPRQDIGAFCLFRGLVANKEGDTKEALGYLKQYMDISLDREYIKEISDTSKNRVKAFRALMGILFDENVNISNEFLSKLEQFYFILHQGQHITDSIQGQQYTQLHWMKQRFNRNNQDLLNTIRGKRLIIYGAGIITREILLRIPEIRQQMVVLIDNYMQADKIEGIPVIRHEDMHTVDADLCIVAVPHLETQIKKQIEELEHSYQVVGVNELF